MYPHKIHLYFYEDILYILWLGEKPPSGDATAPERSAVDQPTVQTLVLNSAVDQTELFPPTNDLPKYATNLLVLFII